MINRDPLFRQLIYPTYINATPAINTAAMNSATYFMGFSLITRFAQTFNKFRFYATGTGTNVTVQVELQADNGAGSPSGTALDTGTLTFSSNTAQWREVSNFSGYTLTPGQLYWVVVKNITATPASNYPTVTFSYGQMPIWVNTDATQCRFYKKATSDGSTWGSAAGTVASIMFGFSDGSWVGSPVVTSAYFSTSGVDRAYTGVELGGVMTTPDNVMLNVVGIWGWIRKIGSPGDLQLKLYLGQSLFAQCIDVPAAQTSTSAASISGFFSRPVVLPPKAKIRIMHTSTAGDNTSNYYYLSGQTYDSNYPDNAPSVVDTYTRLASGTFTDTAGKCPAMALLLDGANPFLPLPLDRRKYSTLR